MKGEEEGRKGGSCPLRPFVCPLTPFGQTVVSPLEGKELERGGGGVGQNKGEAQREVGREGERREGREGRKGGMGGYLK